MTSERGADLAGIARRGMPFPIGVGIRNLADGTPALLALEEQSLGPKAVERRRVYFSMGRAAARDALAELADQLHFQPPRFAEEPPRIVDILGVAIGRGPSGEPLWPDGIVGAISHAGDVAIAIVGLQRHYAGLGIDIEQLSRGLTARAARLVCTPAEMEWVDPDGDTTRLTMLFSAKEAVFKALFPIEGVWLGFGDAELTWHPDRCAFVARLLKAASWAHPRGTLLEVRCSVVGDDVLSTTYALPGG